jgi:2-polyprenyl-3-methyl-5-hydroxy-6-metoxy-1,4-benzoquinol methylase
LCVSEAEFFEEVLKSDISKSPSKSHLVEIGAGIGLLALNLATQGFEVTAFEPEASGFTEMHAMREVILSNWIGKIPTVNFFDHFIDATTEIGKPADFMFAINVIEHAPEY